MAKISLRAYNREIETLIERGQSEEAIAHCKFILKTYPKHLDTYRLLGKAFLETQRYGEAADILQRILSVQPDDFVSQIGMSIIREDEGNLDAALFHMERAFEIQPSNAAIQDELRRLYGRRDGVEPPKLRLTRGALVRMYARGDLYRQAIAEARAALAEDNQRLDIQIILARMYFLMGQKAEAAEISSKLVAKLPYCFEANRILAEVLPETSRSEDAKIYQQHLLALDPYLGYLSDTAPTINQVPDQVVTIDRLEWTPSLETNEQPAWANSLGISIDSKAESKAEDWMSPFAAPEESTPVSAEPAETQTADQPENEFRSNAFSQQEGQTKDLSGDLNELPSWMSDAGWGVSDLENTEAPIQEQLQILSEGEPETEPAPAEMPDWLKNLAPSEEMVSHAENEQEKLDWLSSILPADTETSVEGESIEVTQPTSISGPTTHTPPEIISPVNEDLPDWLRSGTPAVDESNNNQAQLSEEPLPDWLTESDEPALSTETNRPVEEQDKLIVNFSEEQPSLQVPILEPTLDSSAEQNESQPMAVEGETAPVSDGSNMDDAMAWLESLAAKQGADEEALLTKPEERQEQPPEWVIAAAQLKESAEVSPAELDQQASEMPSTEVETNEAGGLQEPDAIPAVEESDQGPSEEFPGTPFEPEVAAIEEAVEEPAFAETTLEDQPAEVEPQLNETQNQTPASEAVLESPSTPLAAEEDMDAAFAWLESLAAKQGAETDSLLVAPEERLETPPDWVKEQSSGAVEVPIEQSPATTYEPEKEPDAALPVEIPAMSQDENLAEPELPDWLKDLEPASEPLSSPLAETGDLDREETFPQEGEIAEAPSGPVNVPESAGWVQEISNLQEQETLAQEEESAPAEPAETTFGKTGPLPRWLAEPAPEAPTERVELEPDAPAEPDLPDWLQDQPKLARAEELVQPIDEVETPPLPDWLQNIESEKVEVPLPESPVGSQAVNPVQVDLSTEPGELLNQAQQALSAGQIDLALSAYNTLVQKDDQIEETIHDLKDALYRYPVESSIWQTLGDALIRANRVQDALDAYTKAEELLK